MVDVRGLTFLIPYLLLLTSRETRTLCPQTCSCKEMQQGAEVVCNGPNHWNKTTRFPQNTVKLQLVGSGTTTALLETLFQYIPQVKNVTLVDTGIVSLSETLFSKLGDLRVLQLLQSESITHIDNHTFAKLNRLLTFRISNNIHIPFKDLTVAIANMQAPQLDTLVIDKQGTKSRYNRPALTTKFYRSLAHKRVTKFAVTNNFIQTVKSGYSRYVPQIKCIILSGNLISNDWASLFELIVLKELRYMDVSHQGKQVLSEHLPDINQICLEPLPSATEVRHLDPKILKENEELMKKNCKTTYALSPNARYIMMSDLYPGVVLSPFTGNCFFPDNHVRYIDAPHNPIDHTDLSMGLIRMQYYNIQYNRLTSITNRAFGHYLSLTTLLVAGNRLGAWFSDGNATYALRKLTKLTSLDLAYNAITNISLLDLRYLMGIENINLSGNALRSENLNYDLHLNFDYLNLSHNKLTHLSELFQKAIDRRKIPTQPRIDLTGNQFLCECKYLDFLEWLIKSKKRFINIDSYKCTGSEATVVKTVEKLRKKCTASHIALIIGSVFGLFAVISIAGFSYRYKNQLDYYLCFLPYLNWKRLVLRPQNYELLREEATYDVFVVNSRHDQEFVTNVIRPNLIDQGLNVFIADEEFAAGDCLPTAILSAINRCRCTLLIVSRNLQQSSWCNYEILTSLALRRRVVILSIDEIPTRSMIPGLIHLSRLTRLVYPMTDERIQLRFWERLARDLRHQMNQL